MDKSLVPDWVYLIQFSSGTVKIGRTKRIDDRIKEHDKHARAHGVNVTEAWCAIVDNGNSAESALLVEARHMGTPIAGNPEFFEGLDFEYMRAFATARFGDRATQEAQADAASAASLDRFLAGHF